MAGDRQGSRHRAGPAVRLGAGALFISVSSVLIDLAATSPGTASFYRCALSLPFLAVAAWFERRRHRAPGRDEILLGLLGGAFFAGDMLLWTRAIAEVGAGLSTVVVNVQVIGVPLLAWAIDRETVPRRFVAWVPVMILGVALTAGLVDGGAAGTDPVRGTIHAVMAAACYSVFLYLLRRSGLEGRPIQNYFAVIASAAVVSLVAGWWWRGVDLTPGLRVIGWLMGVAVAGTVVGWLLVATYSPQLPSHVGAALLMLTPVGALALSSVVLHERPTVLQLIGSVLILGGAYFSGNRLRGRRTGRAPDRPGPAPESP
ncbi:DMT family transporter [Kribbella shirazensis]|uniref:Drug/metabolite transporter (DMT)-like permease n=1 Tax=Kribbella shirazensis TaxID=1105143 RepID=A0A7X5VAX0_9ACTN|nr:DMT family transporter [Kribbella shirazensis]NIK57157.1 drug/metabolite transporter (DMT)-like permease [Kribbella shirazensis]